MTDRISELGRQGQWDEYKAAVKKRWETHVHKRARQADDDPLKDHQAALMMLANKLPIELWIEPRLWEAARQKAGDERRLKATIRELLKLWVAGDVEPWGDPP